MNQLLVSKKLLITGVVQGVGFREWTRRTAQSLGVNGWVRNLPAGSVEALLQGEESKVQNLVELMRRGPRLAQVLEIKVCDDASPETFHSFEVRR